MHNRRDFLLAAAAAATATGLANAAGPTNVVVRDIDLATADPARALPLRLFMPLTGRHLPLVLFSHGAYSSGRLYDPILRHWAAAGFVILAPTHRDSVSLGVKRGSNDPRYFSWRLEDMEFLVASLGEFRRQAPEFSYRVDRTRIAATGHSFGGLVAQTLAGATYFDPASGNTIHRNVKNVRAAIVFSGAGRFAPLLRSEDFAALKLPLLVTVGTEDLQQAPGLSGYQWRREPFDLAASKPKYLLTLQGADHYLGGLVGRDDLPQAAQGPAWLTVFNQTCEYFLRRYVAGKRAAMPGIADGIGHLESA
jgi:dienelactone hydrolase